MTNHANDDRNCQCINCEERCGKLRFHCPDCARWMEDKWRKDQKTRWFNVTRNIRYKFFDDTWPDGWPERLTRKTKFKGPTLPPLLGDQNAPKGP